MKACFWPELILVVRWSRFQLLTTDIFGAQYDSVCTNQSQTVAQLLETTLMPWVCVENFWICMLPYMEKPGNPVRAAVILSPKYDWPAEARISVKTANAEQWSYRQCPRWCF
jgi:hypothetical protein